MTRLEQLFEEHGQSPWLDNLRRDWLGDGTLAAWVQRGVRGITSNPSIFQKAIAGSDHYDEQFRALVAQGTPVLDAYWEMVIDDIAAAAGLLADVHASSGGDDGFVSLEVAPDLAHRTDDTLSAAEGLWNRLAQPNLMVKIPGTEAGLPAIRSAITRGINVNVTLLFSVERYGDVVEAYIAGLEDRVAAGQPIGAVRSVASFFVSRVDTEVDRRLDEIGTPDALELRGQAAVAQAQVAYDLFAERFAGPRWEALEALGAAVQRPLWASTSTKNPDYLDTLYVDTLIGPHTVNTLPEATLEAFADHGTLARTVDADPAGARSVLDRLAAVGVDLADVSARLEEEGVAAFAKSFDELIAVLEAKATELRG